MRWRLFQWDRRSIGKPLALVLVAQGLLVVAVWTLTLLATRGPLARSIEREAMWRNVAAAHEFSDAVAGLGVEDLSYRSPGWERVQQLVERRAAGGTSVWVLDGQGRVLCRDGLREDPSLRGARVGDGTILTTDGEAIALGAPPGAGVAGRVGDMPRGTHLVGAVPLAELGATVLVHRPRSGLAGLGAGAVAILALKGVLLGAVLLGGTSFVVYRVVRRRSRVLEMINEHLGGEIDDSVGHSIAARHALILGLAKLADCRDTDTGAHLERICVYCVLLAERLKGEIEEVDDFWIENLRVAASLHDIGKVGIPDSVLLKRGPLNDAERAAIERHPLLGADTLIAIRQRLGHDDLIEMSLQICLSHHERWDGAGYPYGLAGEDIPLAARLVALADVYDALTSERVYKPSMAHERAVAVIRAGRGTHFDPRVVDAFLSAEEAFRRTQASMRGAAEHEAWAMLWSA